MPRKRRSFTQEFKAEAVRLCRVGDRSVGQVAKDLDLDQFSIARNEHWPSIRPSHYLCRSKPLLLRRESTDARIKGATASHRFVSRVTFRATTDRFRSACRVRDAIFARESEGGKG